jgi:hypothetical protein
MEFEKHKIDMGNGKFLEETLAESATRRLLAGIRGDSGGFGDAAILARFAYEESKDPKMVEDIFKHLPTDAEVSISPHTLQVIGELHEEAGLTEKAKTYKVLGFLAFTSKPSRG